MDEELTNFAEELNDAVNSVLTKYNDKYVLAVAFCEPGIDQLFFQSYNIADNGKDFLIRVGKTLQGE